MISKAVEDTKFCLEKVGEGYQLRRDHTYYYQVSENKVVLST